MSGCFIGVELLFAESWNQETREGNSCDPCFSSDCISIAFGWLGSLVCFSCQSGALFAWHQGSENRGTCLEKGNSGQFEHESYTGESLCRSSSLFQDDIITSWDLSPWVCNSVVSIHLAFLGFFGGYLILAENSSEEAIWYYGRWCKESSEGMLLCFWRYISMNEFHRHGLMCLCNESLYMSLQSQLPWVDIVPATLWIFHIFWCT